MGELFDLATSMDALYAAFQLSKRESDWKSSVQRFEMNLLPNLVELHNELRSGTYKQSEFYEFTLNERGKTRHIRSMHIRDRVVQRSVCDNILTPTLERYLIYDNGASIKGKGISFSRNRLQCHLEKFYRRHGLDGWVLKIDFSKFFDNIRHDRLMEMIEAKIDDKEALELIRRMIASFSVDVTGLPEEQVRDWWFGIYDSVKYQPSTGGKRFMPKGLGIGSQISQIGGVYVLTPVDQYCKTVRQCKYYGRYMDDIYIIHHDKAFLKDVLENIKTIALRVGLHVNDRKTTITPLRHGFSFMHVKYAVTNTGHIVKRLMAAKMTRERRKLKRYRGLLDSGRMTREDISNAYQSWRGNVKPFDANTSMRNMDKLYNQLFVDK